jgi:hypothetical protein
MRRPRLVRMWRYTHIHSYRDIHVHAHTHAVCSHVYHIWCHQPLKQMPTKEKYVDLQISKKTIITIKKSQNKVKAFP